MIVLSLFDGISCGQEAFKRANIKADKYYASEIDKNAIAITKYNWPNTIHLGDVNNWKEWNIEYPDIIIGGSPCQGFSNAGKKLNFDDNRSKLFFKFIEVLNFYKPKYFLLENVKMKKKWQDIISTFIGVKPLEINSALVSAQNRKRLYWTNIKNIEQPNDKNIKVKDILIDNFEKFGGKRGRFLVNRVRKDEQRKTTQKLELRKDNLACRQIGETTDIKGHKILRYVYDSDYKCPTITACSGGNQEKKFAINNIEYRRLLPIECERLQTLQDDYTKYGININNKQFEVSKTQRYKTLGNGWTVDVIVHILKYLNLNKK